MKKFDLILFNGEDILDLRIKLMYKYVDFFIIVEFDKTFQNKKKKFYFDIKKFKKFKKKIIYKRYKLPNTFKNRTAWEVEAYQRESLIKNINIKDRDMIILSDVDEIIDPKKIKYKFNEIQRYELLNLRFYCNYLNLSSPYWINPLSTSFNVAKDVGLEALRASHRALKQHNKYAIYRQFLKYRKNNLIKNAGWHFSSLKNGKENILITLKKKLSEYSHVEFKNKVTENTDIFKYKIKYGLDINDSVHLWGAVNEKLIKNYKVLSWMKNRNLIYKKYFNYIKPNFERKFPHPSFVIRLIIRTINLILYYLFYFRYLIIGN